LINPFANGCDFKGILPEKRRKFLKLLCGISRKDLPGFNGMSNKAADYCVGIPER